jgi:hypothetical protein
LLLLNRPVATAGWEWPGGWWKNEFEGIVFVLECNEVYEDNNGVGA